MLVVMLLLAATPPDVEDGIGAIGYSSSRSAYFLRRFKLVSDTDLEMCLKSGVPSCAEVGM